MTRYVLAIFLGLVAASFLMSATAQAATPDHYKCYKAKGGSAAGSLGLEDQFETAGAELKNPKSICPPVDKDGEGILDPNAHMMRYQIKQAAKTVRRVLVSNQYGLQVLETIKADSLLVPSAKSLTGPPNPLASDHDHYKCYKAKDKKKTCTTAVNVKCKTDGECPNGGTCYLGFASRSASLTDQLNQPSGGTVEVKKPKLLCTPVNKNGEGLINSVDHLVGYQIKGAKGSVAGIRTDNQFGSETLSTIKDEYLFVPSLKNCGNGLVDEPSETCDVPDDSACPGECKQDCTCPVCGDGVINVVGETCEPPGAPGGGNGNLCRGDCTVCGDSVKDAGEECDDGNGTDDDGCDSDCTLSFLDSDGDGVFDDRYPGVCTGGETENCNDNCRYTPNPGQEDAGGVGAEGPDGIGDACQCGDVTGDGKANSADATMINRESLGLSAPAFNIPGNCDVTGDQNCNSADATMVTRKALGLTAPAFGQNCENAMFRVGTSSCVLDPNTSFLNIDQGLFNLFVQPSGDFDVICGAVDPATGKAECTCELQNLDPFELAGIGFVCFTPLGGCDPGEIDCDGGNALDVEYVTEHTMNRDPEDPNSGVRCASHDECAASCEAWCPVHFPGSVANSPACEGYCLGGPFHMQLCDDDDQCLDPVGDDHGSCSGPDGGHVDKHYCNCSCARVTGTASPPGTLQCNLGMRLDVELTAPPCGDDIFIGVGSRCIPISSNISTGGVNDGNASGITIPAGGAYSLSGSTPGCAALGASSTTGLNMVGVMNFLDSTIGDLSVGILMVCQ